MGGPLGFLQSMIAQIYPPYAVGGGGMNNYTSIYALTVYVAQGHERATDDRTGLSLGDMMHPFETLAAACDAIRAAALQFVCIRISSGYYDEVATLPDYCDLFGEGDQVYITRLVCDNGAIYGIWNIQPYNDAALGSAAPNQAVLYVEGGSVVYLHSVFAENVYKNSYAGDPAAIYVADGSSLNITDSRVFITQTNSGTNGATMAAIFFASDTGTLTLNGGAFQAESVGVGAQNAAAVLHRSGTQAGVIVSSGAQLSAFLTSNAGSGYAAGIWADGAAAGLGLVSGGFVATGVGSGGVGTSKAVVGGVLGAGAKLQFSGVQAQMTPATAGRFGAGVSGLGNELRLLDMTYPGLTAEPPQVGTLGGVFYSEGVLGDGVRFPQQSTEIISGNTIWVDNGPDATDTRTGLDNYDRAHPFLTPAAAMAAAVAGDSVHLLAGVYVDNVLVTAGVHLTGDAGAVLVGDGNASPTVRLQANSTLSNLVVYPADNGVSAAASAVRSICTVGQVCWVRNVGVGGPLTLLSLTTAGLDEDGGGLMLTQGIYTADQANPLGFLMRVTTGAGRIDIEGLTCSDPVGVHVGILLQSGAVTGGGVNLQTVYDEGIQAQAVTAVQLAGCAIGGVGGPAVRCTSSTATIRITAANFLGNTLDLEIDSGAADASVIIQGAWDVGLIDAPSTWWGSTKGGGIAQRAADANTRPRAEQTLIGDVGVGQPLAPAKVGITSGLPTETGLVVFRNTDTDVGTWSDITQDLLDGTPVDLFSALTSVARVYFGCDFASWAVLLGITTGLAPGYQVGVERWNGGAWVSVAAFETQAQGADNVTPPLRRGLSELLQNTGENYLRWATPSTAPNTLNGETKYWIRVGFTGTPPASPQAASCKMVGAGEVRDLYGRRQYFGGCRPSLQLPTQQWTDQGWATNASPTSFSIAAIRGVSLTSPDALFLHTSTYSLGSLARIPAEVDPCAGLVMDVFWAPVSTAAGDVRFFATYNTFNQGEVYTAGAATVAAEVVAAGGVANAQQLSSIDLPIGTINVPDVCLLPLTIARNGTDGADTYQDTVTVFCVTMNGLKWRD